MQISSGMRKTGGGYRAKGDGIRFILKNNCESLQVVCSYFVQVRWKQLGRAVKRFECSLLILYCLTRQSMHSSFSVSIRDDAVQWFFCLLNARLLLCQHHCTINGVYYRVWLDTLVTFDLLWSCCHQWPHRPEVKRSKPSDLGFPNVNHMCRVHANDSDKSTLFSLHGSVYMKMWQIRHRCCLSIKR